jgi:hypothetical protein
MAEHTVGRPWFFYSTLALSVYLPLIRPSPGEIAGDLYWIANYSCWRGARDTSRERSLDVFFFLRKCLSWVLGRPLMVQLVGAGLLDRRRERLKGLSLILGQVFGGFEGFLSPDRISWPGLLVAECITDLARRDTKIWDRQINEICCLFSLCFPSWLRVSISSIHAQTHLYEGPMSSSGGLFTTSLTSSHLIRLVYEAVLGSSCLPPDPRHSSRHHEEDHANG